MFSVIIPFHNNERQIERSITSVLGQTYSNFELLLIDDASTDNSLEAVQSFKDSRIRVLGRDIPGPGGYAARNLGVNKSRFDWICFLDADDEWLPNHLEQKAIAIHAHPGSKLITCGWMDSTCDEIGQNKFYQKYYGSEYITFDALMFLKESIQGNTIFHTNVTTVHKQLLFSVGLFPEFTCKRGGDVATWLNCIMKVDFAIWIPFVGAIYHREDSFVTKTTKPQISCNCIYLAVARHIPFNKRNVTKIYLKKFSNYHLVYGLVAAAKEGNLRIRDLRFFYFSANISKSLMFVFFALLPRSVQKKFWSLYSKIKGLL